MVRGRRGDGVTAYDLVIERLESVTGGRAAGTNGTRSSRCPAHEDTNPSLSVSQASMVEGGGVVLHCHAGCTADSIVAALGLTMADLFDRPSGRSQAQEVVRYPYTDEQGKLLFTLYGWSRGSTARRRASSRFPPLAGRGREQWTGSAGSSTTSPRE